MQTKEETIKKRIVNLKSRIRKSVQIETSKL